MTGFTVKLEDLSYENNRDKSLLLLLEHFRINAHLIYHKRVNRCLEVKTPVRIHTNPFIFSHASQNAPFLLHMHADKH